MEKKRLVIAIPSSVIADTPHLREKTSKIGLIGRAAAIFMVDEIVVYRDNQDEDQNADLELVATLLSYLETPQYLRKRLFKIDPRLQFAGILPPLRTPHHPTSSKAKNLKVGDYREGVVLSSAKEGLLVDIGIERPALLREKQNEPGRRLTLQIVRVGDQVEVQVASRSEIPDYWGYVVTTERGSFVRAIFNVKADLALGTSRKGSGFTDVAEELALRWNEARSVLVAFGSPERGLYEIAAAEGRPVEELFDFVVNMVPCQGTETVRTEEALLATLAALNLSFGC